MNDSYDTYAQELQVQLKAADELAAAAQTSDIYMRSRGVGSPGLAAAIKAYRTLRLREPAQVQPAGLWTCPACDGVYYRGSTSSLHNCPKAHPAIPQGEGAQEPATCQVRINHRAIGGFQFCGAPMPCAAHPRGEKA